MKTTQVNAWGRRLGAAPFSLLAADKAVSLGSPGCRQDAPARCQHLCRVPMSSNVRAEDKRDKPQRTQLLGEMRCGGGFYLILKFLWDPDSF